MTDASTEQRLNELLERERAIIKKMNLALRAGANPQVIGQFDFMLQEVRFAQQDLRQTQKANKGDGFDDFLSIG